MAEPSFTPGPWRFQALPSREVRLKRPHWAIGQVYAPAKGVGLAFGDTDANARLIAAAPEMYRVLVAAKHALRSHQYGNASPDLAKEIADAADELLARLNGDDDAAHAGEGTDA